MAKVVSKAWSFDGWDVWEFLRGRKRMAVTLLAAAIAFGVSDQAAAAAIAGGLVEAIFAVFEYFAKERRA